MAASWGNHCFQWFPIETMAAAGGFLWLPLDLSASCSWGAFYEEKARSLTTERILVEILANLLTQADDVQSLPVEILFMRDIALIELCYCYFSSL